MKSIKINPINIYQFEENEFLEENFISNPKIEDTLKVVHWNFQTFRNVIFDEPLKISNVYIKYGMEFIGCTFNKGIFFENVKTHDFDISRNPTKCGIKFSTCIVSEIYFDENCIIGGNININENSVIGRLIIKNSKIGFDLNICDSTISKFVHLSKAHLSLKLSNTILQGALSINSLKGDVFISSCLFKGKVNFKNIGCPLIFKLEQNKFEDEFNIDTSRISRLFISGDIFERKGSFKNNIPIEQKGTGIDEINIANAKFIEGFDFIGYEKDINKINIIITPAMLGLLRFEGWNVNSTLISGVNQNIKLLFKRISFQFLLFKDFTNYSDLSLDKCSGLGDSKLQLIDCDLGVARINEFDFDSFKKITLDNASLDRIKLSSIKWFKEDNLQIEIAEQTKAEEYRRRREIYRQIKQALKSNGNQIESLIFQSRELSAFRNELKNSVKYSLEDRLIMIVSRTNNYGINWFKPLVIVCFITVTLYCCLLPCLSTKISYTPVWKIDEFENTKNVFFEKSSILWQLFNPVRQFKTIYGEIENSWVYFLDLLHRIFLGIMIFQIIKAFRKHVSI